MSSPEVRMHMEGKKDPANIKAQVTTEEFAGVLCLEHFRQRFVKKEGIYASEKMSSISLDPVSADAVCVDCAKK